jgi:hypothetical protein
VDRFGPYPNTRWVVRPLRHRAGQGYRITQDPTDHDPAREYVQELYPKRREYRIIYCMGVPIITLLKRVPENADPDGPWNHACGSTFITIEDLSRSYLRHTDVYDRLSAVPVIQNAHLVAADVLLGEDNDYVVSELNFCPALTIEANLRKVASHVLAAADSW